MELIVVSLASLLAGFVDSIVGGGGLILVPALFATFPQHNRRHLFGTNKGASVWGTAFATVQYSRRVNLPWRALGPAAAACFAASMAGAWLVTVVSPEYLRKSLPLVLALVLTYTLAKKQLGRHHRPRFEGLREAYDRQRHRCRDRLLRRFFWAGHGQLLCVFVGAGAGL
jgi:uncharacterized membrane protein YfcA